MQSSVRSMGWRAIRLVEASMEERETPFFVVGCSRSGTSLLRNLLRSHPRLTVAPESHIFPRLWHAFGDPKTSAEAERLGATILRNSWFRVWPIDGLTAKDFTHARTFAEIMHVVYGRVAKSVGRERWGDKTPQYVEQISLLWEIFPDAPVIHIIRDGRDVALSLLRMRFLEENMYCAARAWRQRVNSARSLSSHPRANQILEVRYEALLTETETVMRQICAHLGEDFSEKVLEIAEPWIIRAEQPRIGKTRTYRPRPQVIVPSYAQKWRSAMRPKDLEIFEAAAGDLLDELGYERAVPDAPDLPWYRKGWWRIHNAVVRTAARFNSTGWSPRGPIEQQLNQVRGHLRRRRERR